MCVLCCLGVLSCVLGVLSCLSMLSCNCVGVLPCVRVLSGVRVLPCMIVLSCVGVMSCVRVLSCVGAPPCAAAAAEGGGGALLSSSARLVLSSMMSRVTSWLWVWGMVTSSTRDGFSLMALCALFSWSSYRMIVLMSSLKCPNDFVSSSLPPPPVSPPPPPPSTLSAAATPVVRLSAKLLHPSTGPPLPPNEFPPKLTGSTTAEPSGGGNVEDIVLALSRRRSRYWPAAGEWHSPFWRC